jgi:hypothetical protein
MALLRIRLLGAVRVFHEDHTYDARRTQTLQEVKRRCKEGADKSM